MVVRALADPGCFASSDRLVVCCFACSGAVLPTYNCFVIYCFVSLPVPRLAVKDVPCYFFCDPYFGDAGGAV